MFRAQLRGGIRSQVVTVLKLIANSYLCQDSMGDVFLVHKSRIVKI